MCYNFSEAQFVPPAVELGDRAVGGQVLRTSQQHEAGAGGVQRGQRQAERLHRFVVVKLLGNQAQPILLYNRSNML